MEGRDSGDINKQWAADYILGPLYDPEPSQVCAVRPASSTAHPVHPGLARKDIVAVDDSDDDDVSLFRRALGRQPSGARHKPLRPSGVRSKYPPSSSLERKHSLYTSTLPTTRWNQGTILARPDSTSPPRSSTDAMDALGDQGMSRRRATSLAARYPDDRSHTPSGVLPNEQRARDGGGGGGGGQESRPRRASSLRERYPGDMSHRPLAILTREYRAADRAPHLHNPHRQQPHDTIDALDITGPVPGVYHHGGPFDAAMKARNLNKKYAPVEAVRSTNMEALKATPSEFVQDSLVKHVPLQGTAVIPPGMKDFSGRTMQYEEGADLMREEDADGGPYKRWDHIPYRDDDLKGKGEPSFSQDLARRRAKASGVSRGASENMSYEMQPRGQAHRSNSNGGGGPGHLRHRSMSANGAYQRLPPGMVDDSDDDGYGAPSSGLRRSNTTGKSIAKSLKRRFGSLRKKRLDDEGSS